MIISDENSQPILIDSIDVPVKTDYFWVLNLEELDFMLNPLEMFEELTTTTLALEIDGYSVIVPSNWYILVYSEDTSQLDVAEIADLTRGGFNALLYNHKKDRIDGVKIKVVDYKAHDVVCTPLLSKNIMLCHHVGTDNWVCISPSDNYNKFLKNKVIGDLIE
jgi:hypothetical protein